MVLKTKKNNSNSDSGSNAGIDGNGSNGQLEQSASPARVAQPAIANQWGQPGSLANNSFSPIYTHVYQVTRRWSRDHFQFLSKPFLLFVLTKYCQYFAVHSFVVDFITMGMRINRNHFEWYDENGLAVVVFFWKRFLVNTCQWRRTRCFLFDHSRVVPHK